MDSLIGIRCNDFVLIASDMNTSSNIILQKTNEDKFYQINNTTLAYSGSQSEAYRLCEFIVELSLYESINHEIETTPSLVSNLIQKSLHDSLRNKPIGVGCLVGGPEIVNEKNQNKFGLYMVDQYGALHSNKHFCLGYGSFFGCGILDRYYRKDLSVEEGIDVVKRIVDVLKDKFLIGYHRFLVKIIDDSGVNERIIECNQ